MAEPNPYLAHSDPVQPPPAAANPYLQHSDVVQEGPADQLDASVPTQKPPVPGSQLVPDLVRSQMRNNPLTAIPVNVLRAVQAVTGVKVDPSSPDVVSDEGLRSGFQGATLGAGDELAAALRSISPNETYDQALADERARLKEYNKENAIIGDLTPANLLGSLLPAAAFRGRARPTLVGRSLEAAKVGGKVGGLHGFFSGEDGPLNRTINATLGAGVGATLGPALQIATEGPINALAGLGRYIGTKGMQMWANPAERANIVPDRLMMNAIRDAETTPAAVLQKLQEGQNLVKSPEYLPETITDVVGTPMQRQVRAISNFGGPGAKQANEFVANRQGVNVDFTRQYKNAEPANQYERLSKDLADALGVGNKSKEFQAVRGALKGERSEEAKSLYKAAVDNQQTFDIRPVVSEVNSMALAEADPAIVSMLQNVGKSLERTINVQPKNVTSDLVAFQRSKEYIDGLISEAKRAGQDYRVKLLRDVKAKALEAVHLDGRNAAYQTARDAFANKSSLMNAAEEGRNFLRGNSEFTTADFSALSEPEKKMFRYGLWQYIVKEKLNKPLGPTRDFTTALRDPATYEALRMALPGNAKVGGGKKSQAFNELFSREMRMSQTANAIKGNSTTAQQALDAAQMGTWARMANSVRSSGVVGAALSSVETLAQRFFGLNQQTGAIIAKQVLSTDPKVQAATLNRLQQKYGTDALHQFGQMIGPALQRLNRTATTGAEMHREPVRPF